MQEKFKSFCKAAVQDVMLLSLPAVSGSKKSQVRAR